MKKLTFIFILAFVLGILSENTYAISARSAIVIDALSGRILYEHNKDEKRGMASTTKIMTALCALEYGDMDKTVTISPTASGVEGSSMYLAKGEKIKMSDLVYGLMLVSGNDSATALAETISGNVKNFATLMNQKASEIGAYNTNFTNPHGLSDENHYTTAHDLAKITAYAMQNPTFCEIVSTKKKTLPKAEDGYARTLINHNKFLNMYEGCIGVKTGFTKSTGRCLVTSVEKDGMRLICVTLNATDDWNDHKSLYDSIFSEFSPHQLKRANEIITSAKIKNGAESTVNLVAGQDIYIPVKSEEINNLKIIATPFEDLQAPISKGDVLGTLNIEINDNICGSFPLCAEKNVELKKIVFKASSGNLAISLKKMFISWLTCFN